MKKMIIVSLAIMCITGCSNSENTAPQETVVPQTPSPTVCATLSPEEYEKLDSSGSGWGMVKKKGAPPEVDANGSKLLEENNGYYMDKTGEKVLYLTFDQGYENGFTSKILDVLQKEQVPAAFFVTGPYLKNQTELIERMIAEGHIVGNHTVNHLNLPKQTTETVRQELDGLNKMCENLYGVSMHYMRPPEGEYSEKVLAISKDMGYETVMWSFAYKDWDVNIQNGADYAYNQIVPYLHDGAIILLHAVSSDNANALERVIQYAKDEGYTFKSLDDFEK